MIEPWRHASNIHGGEKKSGTQIKYHITSETSNAGAQKFPK